MQKQKVGFAFVQGGSPIPIGLISFFSLISENVIFDQGAENGIFCLNLGKKKQYKCTYGYDDNDKFCDKKYFNLESLVKHRRNHHRKKLSGYNGTETHEIPKVIEAKTRPRGRPKKIKRGR